MLPTMSDLTEHEIFARMTQSLRVAAEYCDQIAVDPFRGFIYEKLVDELKLIEGCCQQASAWREDTRWLLVGYRMAQIHQQAGDWLRGYKIGDVRITLAEKHKNMNFVGLAILMRGLFKVADELKTKAAPKLGMIVPLPAKPFMRDIAGKKYQVKLPPNLTQAKSGLIVPKAVTA